MNSHLSYFLRFFFPSPLYAYSTKVRIPRLPIDFRKFLVARHLLKEGGMVIDGGAHIGYYTRYFSELVGERGKVFSFEPNPYIFRLLQKYAVYRENITAIPKALSNHSKQKVPIYLTPYSLKENSTLEPAKREGKQKKVEVETMRIDDLDLIDLKLIKLDVEGHEALVMEGAEKTLKQFQPWIIFEYTQNPQKGESAVISLMKKSNYFLFDLDTLKPLDPQRWIELTDVVAVPASQKEGSLSFLETLSYY